MFDRANRIRVVRRVRERDIPVLVNALFRIDIISLLNPVAHLAVSSFCRIHIHPDVASFMAAAIIRRGVRRENWIKERAG
jgi:hypothetical protein